MMAGHGLMWSNIYQPEKPKVMQRVDWKRLGALFAPYWRQQAMVLVCIFVVASARPRARLRYREHHRLGDSQPQPYGARNRRRHHSRFGLACRRGRRSARLSQLGRGRGNHARYQDEPGSASPPHAVTLLHRHQDGRDHEPRQQRRGQRRQRRHRYAHLDRHQLRPDRHDRRRHVRLELAAGAALDHHRSAHGVPARPGRAADVSDPQAHPREARRNRIHHSRDALHLGNHADQVVRARSVRTRPLLSGRHRT